MQKKYYLDTSIWLDFIENRNEPNFPKGEWASRLIRKIIRTNSSIVVSDVVIDELKNVGYGYYEIMAIMESLPNVYGVSVRKKHRNRAKQIAARRNVPPGDVVHALIAKEHKAILVTLDFHFLKLRDIIRFKRPQELI